MNVEHSRNGSVPVTTATAAPRSEPPGPSEVPFRPPGESAAKARLRDQLCTDLAARLPDQVLAQDADRHSMSGARRRQLAQQILQEAAEAHARTELATPGGLLLAPEVEQRVIASVLDEYLGLAGLEPLLADPDIETININGADAVFVHYADGRRARMPPVAATDADLIDLVRELAARSGLEERRFDRAKPITNFQLPSGERVSAVMAVTARPTVSIRRHRHRRVTLAELRALGTLDRGLESLLAAMVRARFNLLITGATAIGKTTLLRALASVIPPWERLITIEDVLELGLGHDPQAHPDVVAMQAREANIEGQGRLTLSELVWEALRLSPDRIIVGEVRGPEVIPLTNAMSTGNNGSMGTLHAASSHGAFTKLAAYAVQGEERLPIEATNLLVASAVNFVVHLDHPRGRPGGRVVTSVREVVGADGRQMISNEIYRPGPDTRAVPGAPLRADTLERLAAHGFDPALSERPEGWWQA
ncbi:Flp pilus assembly complex ATPase component TadA [Crossiella sp. SN42]|uniref:CpaF family protein n=1 Tax=Crossiella sp. SN42 TaxID=2944808 RepID=UPI00207CC7EB|nr:ATPase, T2SS/T4P/T4SS family [Crossiella sp. SN42]MCO1575876.1 Flp pilus assembly complex ATPase component TadA [Crossiella sp. SN42]